MFLFLFRETPTIFLGVRSTNRTKLKNVGKFTVILNILNIIGPENEHGPN